jgi:hypothetical protein
MTAQLNWSLHTPGPLTMATLALKDDGTLKDASEMEWEYSPGQNMPAPLALPPSPIFRPKKWKGVQFMPTIMPSNFASTQNKRKCNTTLAANKSEVTTKVPVVTGKKGGPVAINHVKRLDIQMGDDIPDGSNVVENQDVEEKKKRRKGEALVDILMVFQQLDPDVDNNTGFECLICM